MVDKLYMFNSWGGNASPVTVQDLRSCAVCLRAFFPGDKALAYGDDKRKCHDPCSISTGTTIGQSLYTPLVRQHILSGLLGIDEDWAPVWYDKYHAQACTVEWVENIVPKFGYIALHERRVPDTRRSAELILVTPAKVYVIHTARDAGDVALRDETAEWSRKRPDRLMVGTRDCTHIAKEVEENALLVRRAVRRIPEATDIAVSGMLVFPNGVFEEGGLPFLSRNVEIRDRDYDSITQDIVDDASAAERNFETFHGYAVGGRPVSKEEMMAAVTRQIAFEFEPQKL